MRSGSQVHSENQPYFDSSSAQGTQTLGFLNNKYQFVFLLSFLKFEIVLSIAGFWAVSFRSTHLGRNESKQTTKDKPSAIQPDLGTNLGVLFNLRSLYSATDEITSKYFNSFVQYPLSTNPDIPALEWIPRVSEEQMVEHESSVTDESFSGYRIVERQGSLGMTRAISRREHFPVGFVELFEGNETAFLMAVPPRIRKLVIEP